MDNGNLDNIVFALLFSADEPLTMRKITAILDPTPAADVRASIETWRKKLDDESWSVSIEKVAGGYQLSSRPEYAQYIARLYSGRRKMRLSRAALETLAIIAYKQPITRAEIENVRGVACGGVITNLMERALIRITGKAKILGAPFLYGSTPEFLEYLGLNSLKDLPSMEELEELLEREERAVAGPETAAGAEGAPAAEKGPEGDETPEVSEERTEPEEELPEETQSPTAPVDEPVAVSTSARLGPDVEEPYHRPLGGPETTPVQIETEQPDTPGQPEQTDEADEETPDKRDE
jgi:segregation and condensation protein B